MVTNYPQQLSATADVKARVSADDGVMSRAFGRLGQILCGMRGHDAILHYEGSRVMMRCTSCGHDSPGWEIGGRGPRKRFDGDARRHQLGAKLVLRKTA
jgi:hypothetical protein